MRTKNVIRYYCDFCKKGVFKKPTMLSHEVSCTKNPNRKCWMCEGSIGLADIIAAMKKHPDVYEEDEAHEGVFGTKSDAAISWLREQTAGCPACMLSVLRQGKIYAFEVFDYKEAAREWHKEKSDEIREACQ